MSSVDTVFLTVEDLMRVIRRASIGTVRDLGLLEAAVARPRSSAFGHDAYATPQLKAAALLHSLVRNHALVDGNERLAWLATVIFLDVNGEPVEISHDAAFALVMAAAEGSLDLEGIALLLSAD